MIHLRFFLYNHNEKCTNLATSINSSLELHLYANGKIHKSYQKSVVIGVIQQYFPDLLISH